MKFPEFIFSDSLVFFTADTRDLLALVQPLHRFGREPSPRVEPALRRPPEFFFSVLSGATPPRTPDGDTICGR